MKNSEQSFNIFLCSFQWFARDAPFIWDMHFTCHWRNWKNCIIFANFLLTNRGCSIEIKGVFVRDNELDLHNVHESPKIEHLPFSDMRKGEGQMKVKNLRKRKQNESSESSTKRLATWSQYQRQKNANELASECREERLVNQPQYQKE